MKDRWRTSRTAVFNIGYHLIWCPTLVFIIGISLLR
jgi:hypothetical protein